MTDMMKQVSEVELAYKILQKTGHSMYFRELITEVLELKGRRIHSLAHAMSTVHQVLFLPAVKNFLRKFNKNMLRPRQSLVNENKYLTLPISKV